VSEGQFCINVLDFINYIMQDNVGDVKEELVVETFLSSGNANRNKMRAIQNQAYGQNTSK
jgi:hypothetical protein